MADERRPRSFESAAGATWVLGPVVVLIGMWAGQDCSCNPNEFLQTLSSWLLVIGFLLLGFGTGACSRIKFPNLFVALVVAAIGYTLTLIPLALVSYGFHCARDC
jgi:hypothetical protein